MKDEKKVISSPVLSWTCRKAGMKKIYLMLIASIGLSATAAQKQIFVDTFANGIPADSDGITGFWTTHVPANTTLVETGGDLILTAGGPASSDGFLSAHVRSGVPESRFNFFRHQLRFECDFTLGGTVPPSQSMLRFVLTGSNQGNYAAEDAFTVRLAGNNHVIIARKQNRPAAPAENVTLASAHVGASITGFTLKLDAENYTAVIRHEEGEGSTTLSGAHGLIAAQWGVDGDSAFQFEILRSTGGAQGAGLNAVAALDNFSVTRLSPGNIVFEDTFSNRIVADSDFLPGFWTAQLPGSSTAEEDGTMLLSARSPSSGNVRATVMSPVSTTFNFFDNQLKFSADAAVSGTNFPWLNRLQFSLASASTNGAASPDTLTLSLGQNQQAQFFRKIGAPNVAPDGNHSAVLNLYDATPYGNGDFNGFELTLNSDRYLVKTFNTGHASGILRISGAHGISREQWGVEGDSALLLETYRPGGAENTVTSGVWDNMIVETDTETLLAEPHIDFQAVYSHPFTGSPITNDYRLWIPSTEPVVRGVIFIGPGGGGDARYMVNDPVAQEAARAIGFALIGYTSNDGGSMNLGFPDKVKPAVQAVLDAAAEASGRPEITNAPLCITGLSAGAFQSGYLAMDWPERTISFVSQRGISFMNLSAATKKVPGLMIAGSTDGHPGTSPYVMQNYFLSWRNQGAQVAFALDWGVSHTMRGNQGWEVAFAWFVEVVNLRYPRPLVPSTEAGAGWPTLINLDDDSGWLADRTEYSASTTPSVTSPFTTIAPYADYTGTLTNASWLPNETCARLYRAFTSTDLATRFVVPRQGALRIVSPAQYADPVPVGTPVSIELDPREFGTVHAIASVQFYNGSTLLGTVTDGNDWIILFTPTDPGLHTITVVATDVLGNRRDAFRALYVIPSNFPPVVYPLSTNISLSAGFSASGTVSGIDPEGGTVTFAIEQDATNGRLTLNVETGDYSYQPAHRFSGTDTFTIIPVSNRVTGTPYTVTVTVAAAVDTNGNGLPDIWESAHGISDPYGDEDDDGFTNYQEYLALTDPNDENDFPRIETITASSESPITLSWPARGGVRYRVQYSDDLSSGWTDIFRPASEEIQPGGYGSPGTGSFTDDGTLTPPPANNRFYSIRIVKLGTEAATESTSIFENMAYGEDVRHVLDLWVAEGDSPRPLLIYIHGGAWTSNDKSQIVGRVNITDWLAKGVSVASINYRYSTTAILPAPVHDAARAIQFLRYKAAELNIDPSRIALQGGSAGACSALWIAFHDDIADPSASDPVLRESSRVQGVVAGSAQTSIDPVLLNEWIGLPAASHSMIFQAVGASSHSSMMSEYAHYKPLFDEFSPIHHLDAQDPPVFLTYPADMTLPPPDAAAAIHHGMFGLMLKEKADAVGYTGYSLSIPGTAVPEHFSNPTLFLEAILLGSEES